MKTTARRLKVIGLAMFAASTVLSACTTSHVERAGNRLDTREARRNYREGRRDYREDRRDARFDERRERREYRW